MTRKTTNVAVAVTESIRPRNVVESTVETTATDAWVLLRDVILARPRQTVPPKSDA